MSQGLNNRIHFSRLNNNKGHVGVMCIYLKKNYEKAN